MESSGDWPGYGQLTFGYDDGLNPDTYDNGSDSSDDEDYLHDECDRTFWKNWSSMETEGP